MDKSDNIGMQTFDSALFQLYKQGKISAEEAIKNADSPNNLRLKINFKGDGTDAAGGNPSGLSLKPDDDKNPFI
jgi:twitching motility protein PilU